MLHAGATWFMVGLIWFVQVVHYPLMGAVPASGFVAYQRGHQRLTTFVVAPAMLLEACSAIFLLLIPHLASDNAWNDRWGGTSIITWIALLLLAVVWVSTFCIQVPLHGRLSAGFDAAVWRRLVATNWLRTICWTLRGVLAIVLLRSPG